MNDRLAPLKAMVATADWQIRMRPVRRSAPG